MKRISLSILIAAFVAAPAIFAAQVVAEEEEEVLTLHKAEDLEWVEAPPVIPEGAEMTILEGDPTDEDLAIWRMRIPADWEFPPHTHPVDERVTILSGSVNVGVGETLDREATERLEAGSHFHIRADHPHYVWTDEETIVHFVTDGATATEFVHPEDDPRVEARSEVKSE